MRKLISEITEVAADLTHGSELFSVLINLGTMPGTEVVKRGLTKDVAKKLMEKLLKRHKQAGVWLVPDTEVEPLFLAGHSITARLSLPASDKKKANKELWKVLKPTYFARIPWDDVVDALAKVDIVPLQEDLTKWSGMFLGSKGEATFDIGLANTENEEGRYVKFDNAVLRMTWYTMESGKYEVIAYIA